MTVVKTCKIHGDLSEEMVYRSKDIRYVDGFAYKCKECCYQAQRNRPCKIHGEISDDDRVESGGCKICAFNRLKDQSEKRNNNREEFNEKMRLKKEANPEWWKEVKRQEYERLVEKEGLDAINERKKAERFKLTIEEFRKMFIEQDNKCAICKQPETRIFTGRGRFKGQMKIAKLCIDHDHKTGKVRALLCHDCNTALGKFDDDPDLIQSAINYLNKHKE